MEYVGGNGEVEVTVTRRIVENGRYRIVSSYGYAGITEGIVEVSMIIRPEDIPDLRLTGDVDEILDNIEEYTRVELDMFTGVDLERHRQHLATIPWIAYYYPHDPHEQGNVYVFPLDMFIVHTASIM